MNAGSIKCCHPPLPVGGSHPKLAENIDINISPRKKPGTEIPKTANVVSELSSHPLGRSAARIPSGTPMITASSIPAAVSSIVAGSVLEMPSSTGVNVWNDSPKSPLAIFFT
ncbi:hypothetical protein D3C84_971110 [compost metagenome]